LAQEERREGRDRAGRQDQAPVDPDAVEHVGDDDRQQEPAVPRRLQARQPPSPSFAGDDLGEHRLPDCVFGADRQAEREAQDQQQGDAVDEGL
jgi:hypothetical protein